MKRVIFTLVALFVLLIFVESCTQDDDTIYEQQTLEQKSFIEKDSIKEEDI